jgi:hypothetical protein
MHSQNRKFKFWLSGGVFPFIVLACLTVQANPYLMPGFKPSGKPQLSLSTVAQSLTASTCSGVVTVVTKSAAGVVTNVGSTLTVNLSGTAGMSFYSDYACSTSITNVTVAAGTSSSDFYFLDTAAGSHALAVAATTFTAANQTETIATNAYVWTGNGGNANWATAGNWSGGAAPNSSTAIAIFDGTCSSNCSPTIAAAVVANAVGGVRFSSGYAGTITQNTGSALNVGSTGWVQLGGTFVGSSGGDAINITNSLVVTGGSYQSTSGTLTLAASGTYTPVTHRIGASATFLANGGTFYFNGACATNYLTPGTSSYKNITFAGVCSTITMTGNLTASGNFLIPNTGNDITVNSGTIYVGGNVSISGTNVPFHGTAVIELTGSATGQTITTSGTSTLGNVKISAGANNVTLSGTVGIYGNYVVNTVGTLTTTGSTLALGSNCTNITITPGTATYNNVSFLSYCSTYDLGGGTLTMSGNLSFTASSSSDYAVLNSGTIAVGGNVNSNYTAAVAGSAVVQLTGKAGGQTVTGTNTGGVPNLTIVAGANNVTLTGPLAMGNYIRTSAGTITATSAAMKLRGPTVTVGAETFSSATFGGNCTVITLSGSMNISGSVTFNDACTGALNGGTLLVKGNLTVTAWSAGTTAITLNGTTQQSLNQAAGNTFPAGTFTLNNAAGLLLGTAVSLNGATQSTTVTSGNISMAGNALTLHALALGGKTVTKSGGTLTVNGTVVGTGSLYGGTVSP